MTPNDLQEARKRSDVLPTPVVRMANVQHALSVIALFPGLFGLMYTIHRGDFLLYYLFIPGIALMFCYWEIAERRMTAFRTRAIWATSFVFNLIILIVLLLELPATLKGNFAPSGYGAVAYIVGLAFPLAGIYFAVHALILLKKGPTIEEMQRWEPGHLAEAE